MAGRYFGIPFATTGDRITVPDATQPDGSVSFTQGFGFDYERPNTDPAYKPVPRDGTNGLFHDITEALGIAQRQGVSDWTVDAQPYPINALVRHTDKVWRSLVANNNVTPVEGANWTEVGALSGETVAGLIEIATTAEAQTLVNDTRALTPKKLVAAMGVLSGIQKFTSSGTFTVPAGVTKIYVTACGGGGGGGSGGSSSTSLVSSGGGGGGAGDAIFQEPFSVTPGQSISIIVGAGGSGGIPNPWGNAGNPGGQGGSTVISSLTTVAGGGPGGAGGVGASVANSGPQTGFNNGQPGYTAFLDAPLTGLGGAGGSSAFGGGGYGAAAAGSPGSIPIGYGSGGPGGSGSWLLNDLNGGAGIPGKPGIVIIGW